MTELSGRHFIILPSLENIPNGYNVCYTASLMRRQPDYYLVIDVEATCDDNDRLPRYEKEIIEMGAVMVDGDTLELIDEFQSFVRPVRHPKLTPFCIDLTTIRQIEVETAPRFPDMMQKFSRWIRLYPGFLFASWGKYDRIQIERDCDYHRVDYTLGRGHLNLKSAYAKSQSLGRPIGMAAAVRRSGLHLQGTHHRGIDDARNIARLLPLIV